MQPMANLKILDTETVWRGNYLDVRRTHYLDKNGRLRAWEFIERGPAVFVFPITDRGTVVLIKQFRIVQNKFVIEIPAGVCDKGGEVPEDTARRELLEETGYVAGNLVRIRTPRGAAAAIRGVNHVFIATGAHKVAEQALDDTENIEVFEVPFDYLVPALLSQPPEIEVSSLTFACHAIASYLKGQGGI